MKTELTLQQVNEYIAGCVCDRERWQDREGWERERDVSIKSYKFVRPGRDLNLRSMTKRANTLSILPIGDGKSIACPQSKARQNNDILELVKLIKHYGSTMIDPLYEIL